MPVTIERLPNEPILIATLTGELTPALLREMFTESARIADAEGLGSPVYRITDVTSTQSTFSEIVFILAEASKGQPGTSSDPRFRGTIAGPTQWAKLYSDSFHQQQYGQLNIPVFETVDDALVYVRQQIAAQP